MTSLLAAARGLHFASVLLVFGELAFALFVAAPEVWRDGEKSRRRFTRVMSWSLAASVASWLVWLGCEAVAMSGASVERALRPHTLALVLGQTAFGRLWLLRLALAAVLAALLWSSARDGANERRRALTYVMFAIAGAYLASVAWAGHAAAGEGADSAVQLVSDVAHLLAAGAWVGALRGLVALLRDSRGSPLAAEATRQFSRLGVASVTLLLFTGFVNALFLVGDVPALIGTEYGRLLLVKLTLFAAMLALAAVNRFVLTPRLSPENAADAARLRRNAMLETGAGVGIVAIVGVLGITIPGAHQSPVWPFSRGLDLEPAYPTSYATSPVRYTTAAIARGAAIYAEDCQGCHGVLGHGDGPAAASLGVKPANLADHAAFHRPGDLFWIVTHGVPGTPMPGFAAKITETDVWNVVRFLRALSDSESVSETGAAPARPIVAPDFPYEIAGRAQESLARAPGHAMTLLVFYTLPQSLPRLRTLLREMRSYSDHAIRVIAVPMQDRSNDAQISSGQDPMRAVTASDVPAVYAMFARAAGSEAAPVHFEFLIDSGGFLRRRWPGVPEAPSDRTAVIFLEAGAVARAPPLTAQEKHHAH